MERITLLIERFKGGSRSAFASLMGELLPIRIRAARRILRGASAGILDAEDIAQRTFWELWRTMARGGRLAVNLSDTTSLLKALAIISRQQISRGRRDARRACRDFRRETPTETEPDFDPWPAIFSASESKEALQKLSDLLPRDRLKAVVDLSLLGLSSTEIAERLHCSERTVVRSFRTALAFWRTNPHASAILAAWRSR